MVQDGAKNPLDRYLEPALGFASAAVQVAAAVRLFVAQMYHLWIPGFCRYSETSLAPCE